MKPKAQPPTLRELTEDREFKSKHNHYERLRQKNIQNTIKEEGVSPTLRTLYAKSLTIVARDIKHLRALSIAEKLPSKFANDLMGYVKLLGEIKKQQRDTFKAEEAARLKKFSEMTDEELEREVRKLLKEKK